jgi:hypothetical protein
MSKVLTCNGVKTLVTFHGINMGTAYGTKEHETLENVEKLKDYLTNKYDDVKQFVTISFIDNTCNGYFLCK